MLARVPVTFSDDDNDDEGSSNWGRSKEGDNDDDDDDDDTAGQWTGFSTIDAALMATRSIWSTGHHLTTRPSTTRGSQ